MTDHTLVAGAPGLPLGPGMVLKLQAIDPTTGAEVSGVKATRWTIYGYDASPFPLDELVSVGPLLVPSEGTV